MTAATETDRAPVDRVAKSLNIWRRRRPPRSVYQVKLAQRRLDDKFTEGFQSLGRLL
ncbi:hypothetical protein MES4922_190168 [Mesorhizobium ventifaucium]|uniref:MarR family transcriptional regulator n=1 Tax=Mesorhizobium ventifaucium TaxID=666020 RepID=A0ABN8JJG8_9HYPH|nr:hypothetical protein MES4922_190168 [Mesorhizobium ventifaucium]